jgi:hypothetical protein
MDPLDRLLAASLQKRTEARPLSDLAQRAMERARQMDRVAQQQRRTLTIHRWRLRFVYTAASMLIGVLMVLGGHRLLVERQSMSSTYDSTSISSSTDSNSSSTATVGTGTYVLWLGGLLFVCTIAGVAAESSIAPDRPSLVA